MAWRETPTLTAKLDPGTVQLRLPLRRAASSMVRSLAGPRDADRLNSMDRIEASVAPRRRKSENMSQSTAFGSKRIEGRFRTELHVLCNEWPTSGLKGITCIAV